MTGNEIEDIEIRKVQALTVEPSLVLVLAKQFDAMDIFRLSEVLTRTETNLANTIERNVHGSSSSTCAVAQIPPYRTWIVKMWHFGVDTRTSYDKREFQVTFEESMLDLYRIYTKRM